MNPPGCLITFFFVVFLVVLAVSWLDQHPGVVNIAFGLVAVVVLGFLAVVVWALIKDSK